MTLRKLHILTFDRGKLGLQATMERLHHGCFCSVWLEVPLYLLSSFIEGSTHKSWWLRFILAQVARDIGVVYLP